VCPDLITVELSHFIGADKIVSDLSKQNFTISLDYVEGSIEKVSYNIEGEKFNLVIEPRPGFPPFTQEKVQYAYTGMPCDIILSVDTIHTGGLRRIYESQKDLFASKSILNIDRHPNNSRYGSVNILDPKTTTTELAAKFLATLGIKFSEDIATNILNALYEGTGNFDHPQMTSSVFELAAKCMNAGGKKFRSHVTESNAIPVSSDQEALPAGEAGEVGTHERKEGDIPSPVPKTQTPDDWLKPKIFKSGGHLL
jgi:hypothetical protein